MPNAVTPSPLLVRAAISIDPSTGCGACDDTGKAISDQLDAEGLWFKHEMCANCNGTGHAVCAAEGCSAWARSTIALDSGGPSFTCCGDRAHTRELVARLLGDP